MRAARRGPVPAPQIPARARSTRRGGGARHTLRSRTRPARGRTRRSCGRANSTRSTRPLCRSSSSRPSPSAPSRDTRACGWCQINLRHHIPVPAAGALGELVLDCRRGHLLALRGWEGWGRLRGRGARHAVPEPPELLLHAHKLGLFAVKRELCLKEGGETLREVDTRSLALEACVRDAGGRARDRAELAR